MRLALLEFLSYTLPFHAPFRTANGVLTQRTGWLVRVADVEGLGGLGEIAPLPEFGTETLPQAELALREWGRALETAELPETPAQMDEWLDSKVPRGSDCPTARAGVEQALLVLLAQRRGVSLGELFTPAPAPRVAVNATLSASAPEEAARQAQTAVSRGYGTLKVKVGVGGQREDDSRLKAVRAAVAPHIKVRADANGAWNFAQALEILNSWKELGLEYVEQPLPQGQEAEMIRLGQCSPIPLAADESATTWNGAQRVLEQSGVALLILKPLALGGLWRAWSLAHRAHLAGLGVVVTTLLEGSVGRTGALHLASALRGDPRLQSPGMEPPACGLATGELLAQDFLEAPELPFQGGLMRPHAPGLGISEIKIPSR